VLSPMAHIEYKCTELYDPLDELGIAWDDPALAIPWPVSAPLMSERDRSHPRMDAVMHRLPRYQPELNTESVSGRPR